jgi:HlyD family secretion protein
MRGRAGRIMKRLQTQSDWPRYRRGDGRRWLLPLAAVSIAVAGSLVLAGCGSGEEKEVEVEANVSVQAATAQTKTIEDEITASATLYPRDQAAIVPKVSAPIERFYVQRGSHVHAGQLLAELENKDVQGTVTESQGEYSSAEADYANAAQKAALDKEVAKQQLQAAQNVYNARETLYKQGAIAAKDVEDSKIALTQAQSAYDLAEKESEVAAAKGTLNAAKGKTQSAEAQLSYTKITSPIDGVVTDRPFYVGETPAAGTAILTVMDLSSVVARAYLSPEQAARLHVGDEATLVAGAGGKEIPGKVTTVSPAVDPNSTTVQVWVEAKNPGEKLEPGTTVTVSIVARTIKNALVVPAEAILTAPDGTTAVMVIGKDGKAHQTAVKTGTKDDDDEEILSGLSAGDQVVTIGAYGLPDGAKVTVTKAPAPGEDKDDDKKPD